MSVSPRNVGAVTVFVEDLARSRAFYERVFEPEVVHEDDDSTVFRFDNLLVNLLTVGAARALVEPGDVGDRDAGPRFQLTIWVDDVDAACARLRARGVTLLSGPIDREWGQRTASFTDPAGTLWELAQDLRPTEGL